MLLTLLPWGLVGPADASPGVAYRLEIACPGATAAVRCPILATDEMDAMGDPTLAVDPDNPQNMIIASLHGSGNSNGPSVKARSGQAFTTFTTRNHGAGWVDNPFTPPANVSGAFGIHPALTIDPYGHVFVGSLYAHPVTRERGSGAPYDYVIAAQKFSDIQDIDANQRGAGDYNVDYMGTIYPGNAIRQMWFTYNRITDNMTMVWTEHLTPHSNGTASDGGDANGTGARIGKTLDEVLAAGGLGGEAEAGPSAADALVAGSATRNAGAALSALGAQGGRSAGAGDAPFENELSPEEPRSVIGVVWTRADLNTTYYAQEFEHVIGPCSTSTNPVISENWLYIGCVVAEGEGTFPWNRKAEPGRVEMFRMHPDGGEPEYIGTSPIVGGMPKIGVRSDGRIALVTTEVENETLRLDAVFGQYDPETRRIAWGSVRAFGDNMDPLPRGEVALASNIQDMIYREYSGVLHLILKRNIKYEEDLPQPPLVPRPTIKKLIVAVDEKYGLLTELDLDIGDVFTRSQDPDLLLEPDRVFDDISDDFLELPSAPYSFQGRDLGDTYQREFFAIADFGIVQFAEVIEITDLRAPPFAPQLSAPPPPTPAPAVAQVVAAAGALTLSSLLAGSIAAAKRKHAVGDEPRKRK